MYRAFFDREPDKGGYRDWMDKMIDGYTRQQVLAGFTKSDEFTKLCAKYGIDPGCPTTPTDRPLGSPSAKLTLDTTNVDDAKLTGYGERLYEKILGRPAEAEGVAYWKKCIMEGKDAETGIEYDGLQHKNKQQQDQEKSDLCRAKGIKLIIMINIIKTS